MRSALGKLSGINLRSEVVFIVGKAVQNACKNKTFEKITLLLHIFATVVSKFARD